MDANELFHCCTNPVWISCCLHTCEYEIISVVSLCCAWQQCSWCFMQQHNMAPQSVWDDTGAPGLFTSSYSHTHSHYEVALLVWMVQESLHPHPSSLDSVTFGTTFRRQFEAAAVAERLGPQYFLLIIFSMLPFAAWPERSWIQQQQQGGQRSRGGGQKMQVRSALQLCSAGVRRDFSATKPFELWTLQLSVKRWPSALAVIWLDN